MMVDIVISGKTPEIIHFTNNNIIPDCNFRSVSKFAWMEFCAILSEQGYSIFKTCLQAPVGFCGQKEFTYGHYVKFTQIRSKTRNKELQTRLDWAIRSYEQLKQKGFTSIYVNYSPE